MVLPGGTLGILGGGQLGRMLAIAARQWGYRVHVFTPDVDSPGEQVADQVTRAPFSDLDAVGEFARGVDVVTYEFENVLAMTSEHVDRFAPVRPSGDVLRIVQHRWNEKVFLRDAGLPTARFALIENAGQIDAAVAHTQLPAVLKTIASGYDGKGQALVRTLADAQQAWITLGEQPLIAEQYLNFACELSVVAVRSSQGDFCHYGPIQNEHRNHILDLSTCPAPVSVRVAQEAVEIARTVLERLDVVGVTCVELFLMPDESLLVNEIAPRPHNSGHLTIDAHHSSQFEQQLRAVCLLPLGSTQPMRPAVMANLLGDLWSQGEPDWLRILSDPRIRLHLYGKREARPGRKMGHLTCLADSLEEARSLAIAARQALDSATPR